MEPTSVNPANAASSKLSPVVRVTDVHKTYETEQQTVEALRGVSFSVDERTLTALVGPSGCGKSTLLHLIAGLDRPTRGIVEVAGRSLADLSDDALSNLRQSDIGIVFQFFNLLPTLSILENVLLPSVLRDGRRGSAETRAKSLMEHVGIGHRIHHHSHQLSGGEQQRAAIARALINEPRLLLADEPTGNLDSDSGDSVLDLMVSLPKQHGTTILMVTHSEAASARCDRVLRLKDGHLVSDRSATLDTSPTP